MLRVIQKNISLFQKAITNNFVRKKILVSNSNNTFFSGSNGIRILPLTMVQYMNRFFFLFVFHGIFFLYLYAYIYSC